MDLTKVAIREINFEDNILLDKSFYEKAPILDIKDLNLHFSIKQNLEQDYVLKMEASGIFLLEDARTLLPVDYPFHILLEEKLNEESEIWSRFSTNSQNTLDILTILWENIVLEIPISYTVSEELQSDDSHGYKIVGNESDENIDPRLAPLLGLLDKEKE